MKYKHKSRNISDSKDQLSFSFSSIKRTWKNNPIILTLAFLALLFFGRAALRVYGNKQESAIASAEAQRQLAGLEKRQTFITDALRRLSTIEGRATELRKKFGVALPNENVAIIIDATGSTTSTSTHGFWSTIKHFFGVK